jgi:2-polyprenyl-6-hydroxyphenyl methylase/3-demethylubiquinone-9 3-methyltransferase
MNPHTEISGYQWSNPDTSAAHEYLLPTVFEIIDGLELKGSDRRIFDLGCGNGFVADCLSDRDYDVIGVDPSSEGIEQARRAYPHLKLSQGSAYDNLTAEYGQFPVVLSLEVVEHVYFPRKYAASIYSLLQDRGIAIISTPYHGYWKNLAMAVTGKMDSHFTALWDYGHIKFWSFKTLGGLLLEAAFKSVEFKRVGRIPCLAKSMIAIVRK